MWYLQILKPMMTGTGQAAWLCYQYPKGVKKNKVATFILLSQEAGWLALSLLCFSTQHSCKQTRLEINGRFPLKIERETKAFFFFFGHHGQDSGNAYLRKATPH